MYFQYGNYQHAHGEVNLSLSKKANRNGRGFTAYSTWTMQIEGTLIGAGETAAELQDNIRAQILALENAYALDGFDAGLLHDDGTPTPHVLDSSASLGGGRWSTIMSARSPVLRPCCALMVIVGSMPRA